MHELSIAMSIVDIASRQAEAASAETVSQIELDIGSLSGIEFESLKFALKVAVRNSMFEHTHFKINRIEALCECRSCGRLYSPGRGSAACPACGKLEPEYIRGRELQIKSLLVEQKD